MTERRHHRSLKEYPFPSSVRIKLIIARELSFSFHPMVRKGAILPTISANGNYRLPYNSAMELRTEIDDGELTLLFEHLKRINEQSPQTLLWVNHAPQENEGFNHPSLYVLSPKSGAKLEVYEGIFVTAFIL